MSDKLTASVIRDSRIHWACLQNGKQTFHVEPMYDSSKTEQARECAQSVVNAITKAIELHDAAVHAELIALRNRLAAALRDLHDEQIGPPLYSRRKRFNASMAEAEAVLAVVEKSHD